jgi:hypothetical protein
MPSSTGLSGTQFSTIKSAGINDLEGPKKYYNTEVKYVATYLIKQYYDSKVDIH